MIARCVAWEKVGTEEALHRCWKRVAYATRYGKAGLRDALSMCSLSLQDYLEAVSELVQEENRPRR